MTDIDLLGPGAAGAPRALSTTTDVTNPDAADTWMGDCVANTPGTGTPYVQKFMNRLMQQVRRVIRLSGVPLNNATDDMLGQAIQSGGVNWAATFGGSGSALTATLAPAPSTLLAGTSIRGILAATLLAGATLNVNGLGAQSIVRFDGSALQNGDGVVGALVDFIVDPSGKSRLRGTPAAALRTRLTGNATLYFNGSTGNDANPGTSGSPFRTAQAAWNYAQQTFDLGGAYSVTLVQQAGAVNTDQLNASGPFVGAYSGGLVSPSVIINVLGTWSVASGCCIVGSYTNIAVNGSGTMGATGTGANQGSAIVASDGAIVQFSGVTLGACGATQVSAINGGIIYSSGAFTIAGNALGLIGIEFNGSATISGAITLSGTPAFSTAFAIVGPDCSLNITNSTFVGSATGSRYQILADGVIYTNGGGASYLPGNASGTIASGGQYL